MPLHDVNDAFDPTFWDTIVVTRFTQTIDNTGRVVRTPQVINTQGVVTASSPNDLNRLPDEQYMNKSITVYTQFRLFGPTIDTNGNQTHPDEITWHGSRFVIRALDDYSGYGRGFMMAVCTSIEPVDAPPLPGNFPATVGTA